MSAPIRIACHGMPDGVEAKVPSSFARNINGEDHQFVVTRLQFADATVTHRSSGLRVCGLPSTRRAPKGGWKVATNEALDALISSVGEARLRSALSAANSKGAAP